MEWLDRLDPTAKKALMIGIPLVALAVLVSSMRDRGATVPAAEEDTAAPGTPIPPAGFVLGGAPDAVNVGELGSMFSGVTDLLMDLPKAISDQIDADRPTAVEAPKGAIPSKGTHTVAKGDTWGTISRQHYGTSGYAGPLSKDSRNASIGRLYPGYTTALPPGTVVTLPAFT